MLEYTIESTHMSDDEGKKSNEGHLAAEVIRGIDVRVLTGESAGKGQGRSFGDVTNDEVGAGVDVDVTE